MRYLCEFNHNSDCTISYFLSSGRLILFLLQKEIEILKPNAIVFITGPSYIVTMEKALDLKENILLEYKPTQDNGCIDISNVVNLKIPTFWTYHPRSIASSKNTLSRDKIVEKIKESKKK